jgi:hypothetical protein
MSWVIACIIQIMRNSTPSPTNAKRISFKHPNTFLCKGPSRREYLGCGGEYLLPMTARIMIMAKGMKGII